MLDPKVSAEHGPWRNDRTPYLVGIMDAPGEPGVEEVIFLKPTQVGFSESTRNQIGFWIDHDPGPMQLVMPNEVSVREAIEERIRPLLRTVPRLARHMSGLRSDDKLTAIHLDTMSLFTGWATSAQSLASRPIRYLVMDEVDKYPASTGEEADPISLAMERTTTFLHRRVIIIGSTPTTSRGPIWLYWLSCGDQRFYQVPCPHCGHYQRWTWDQVKWPDLKESDRNAQADAVEQKDLAWVECIRCKGQIREQHKAQALRRGLWVSKTQTVEDGRLVGERPKTRRVGFHLSSLYSPWKTFSAVVANFLRAIGDAKKMQNFRNSWLAEIFEQQITVTKSDELVKRVEGAPQAGIVPAWAGRLLMTADVQKDHLYWVIRAWGYAFRSRLIGLGVTYSLDMLRDIFEASLFPVEGTDIKVRPEFLGVDSGYRTHEVYLLCSADAARIIPVKGSSSPQASPIRHTRTNYDGVLLRTIDSESYSDRLATHMAQPDTWELCSEATLDYCRQLCAEHKVIDRSGKELWTPVTSGAANHFRDCEKYQIALADLANVHLIPSPEDVEAQRLVTQQAGVDPRFGSDWLNGWRGRH